jgi:thiamine-phosphate pyrophosphorylase
LPAAGCCNRNKSTEFESVSGEHGPQESIVQIMVSARLYAIIDVEFCKSHGLHALDFTREVCAARPACIQLRAKHSTPRDTLEMLRSLVALAHPQEIRVYANDRPDLAILGGADGVHVGQNDLPVSSVRKFAPSLRVGVSTHNELQLSDALEHRPDYVAIGPVFSTLTKQDAEPSIGIDGLALAAQLARAAQIPLVAIGGIDHSRAREVTAHADMIAVISALLPPSGRLQDVRAHIEGLIAELNSP